MMENITHDMNSCKNFKCDFLRVFANRGMPGAIAKNTKVLMWHPGTPQPVTCLQNATAETLKGTPQPVFHTQTQEILRLGAALSGSWLHAVRNFNYPYGWLV